MIKLHQFSPAFGLPNPSPFCMKVETYLRMAGLEYETVNVANPARLPKGKAPVLEDRGRLFADSAFILRYLEQTYPPGLDRGVSERDRAIAHAYARLLEERYYWVMVYSRWIEERSWPTVRSLFFGGFPPVIRSLIAVLARRGVRQSLHGHGLGRHGAEEIYQLGHEDLASLATFMADRPFVLGEEPRSIDAIVYAFLANTLWVPFDTPLQQAAAAHPNFEPYCQRMRDRYWGGESPQR